MATALSMITRSMRLAGAIGKAESLSTDESADGLVALNAMLDSWKINRLNVYQIVQGSYTWTASATSKTIGTGGDFNAQRPDRIEEAYIVDSGSNWYQLHVARDRSEYDSIVTKTVTTTLPNFLFMDTAYPLGVIYLYPVPTVSLTLKLNTWQALQTFAALTTELSLPPGYQRAIEYSLAEEYGPEFGVAIHPNVVTIASQSRASIKNHNAPSMIAQMDSGISRLGNFGGFSILTNGPR